MGKLLWVPFVTIHTENIPYHEDLTSLTRCFCLLLPTLFFWFLKKTELFVRAVQAVDSRVVVFVHFGSFHRNTHGVRFSEASPAFVSLPGAIYLHRVRAATSATRERQTPGQSQRFVLVLLCLLRCREEERLCLLLQCRGEELYKMLLQK